MQQHPCPRPSWRHRIGRLVVVGSLGGVLGLGGWSAAAAAVVSLAADPNTEADWAGDRLYRAPGSCTQPGAFAVVASAPPTTGGATVTFTDTIPTDGTYCYYATALDTAGNESAPSNRVEVRVDTRPPTAPANLRVLGVTP